MMPLFIWGICKAVCKIKDDPRLALFPWFALPILLLFLLVSPFHYVKMNWLAPAYLSVLPIILFLYFKSESRAWKAYGKFALAFSIVTTLIAHVLILLPGIGLGRADTIHGWRELAARIDDPEIVTVKRGEKKIADFYIFQCYKYKEIT